MTSRLWPLTEAFTPILTSACKLPPHRWNRAMADGDECPLPSARWSQLCRMSLRHSWDAPKFAANGLKRSESRLFWEEKPCRQPVGLEVAQHCPLPFEHLILQIKGFMCPGNEITLNCILVVPPPPPPPVFPPTFGYSTLLLLLSMCETEPDSFNPSQYTILN